MAFQLSLPQQLKGEWRVTLALSGDSSLPTIKSQWMRGDDGVITAWYTRSQLCDAVLAGLAIEIGKVQDRLEYGEQLIVEARQRGDELEVAELERHWIAMLEYITHLLDAQVAAQAE